MILTSAQGLGRQYSGDPIFNDLAFEVRAGERIGLVGPNGAGKTTLIRLLARTDQPDYGQLFVRPGIRISLLKQEIVFEPDETLIDVVKSLATALKFVSKNDPTVIGLTGGTPTVRFTVAGNGVSMGPITLTVLAIVVEAPVLSSTSIAI